MSENRITEFYASDYDPNNDPITPEWEKAVDEIENIVNKACKDAGHKKVYITYSAYNEDVNGIPINNLNDIAVNGKVILIVKSTSFFGGPKSRPYVSDVLTDPTWLDVCIQANASVRYTRDRSHIFVESLGNHAPIDGIPVRVILLGS